LVEANQSGLSIEESFYARLDSYVERFYRLAPARNQLVIQTYLAQAAIRIAKSEGKQVVQAEDVKAAIWLYHLPENPDDPCVAAGEQALRAEQSRSRYSRGLLTENLRAFLDQF
jgi:hypothetical protein